MDSKGKLTVKDIPNDMMENMRQQFDQDPTIIQMRVRQNVAQRQGMFANALQIGKQINDLWERVIVAYLDQANKDADSYDIAKIGLPLEDVHKINTLTLAMFMCCDIIDSVIRDVNDIIHKKDPTLQFEMFDEVSDMAKMVKGKMAILEKETTFLKSAVWGDVVDNMYVMMLNKSKSIIRKKAENK
jgi:hypothetical protein